MFLLSFLGGPLWLPRAASNSARPTKCRAAQLTVSARARVEVAYAALENLHQGVPELYFAPQSARKRRGTGEEMLHSLNGPPFEKANFMIFRQNMQVLPRS